MILKLLKKLIASMKPHEHVYSDEITYMHGMRFRKCTHPGCNCYDPVESEAFKARNREVDRKFNELMERRKVAAQKEKESYANKN